MDLLKLFEEVKKEAERRETIIDGTPYIDRMLEFLKPLGDTTIFEKNIETLKIKEPYMLEFEKEEKLEADASYNGLTNTMSIYNMDTIYHELAHVASYKDRENEGVLVPGDNYEFTVGKSFNEGFCDYIASKLDPNYQLRYPLEKLVVDKIIEKFGDEPLKYFLTADYESFHNFINKNNLNTLLSNLDNYTNLYSEVRDPKQLEIFYNSYQTIMNECLPQFCSKEEISKLQDDFLSTPKGVEIDTILFEQEKRNIKKQSTI